MKFIKKLFQVYEIMCLLSLIFLILFGFVHYFFPINIDMWNSESIELYQSMYSKIKSEDFVSGELDEKENLVLTDDEGKKKIITLNTKAGSRLKMYFYEIEKKKNGAIIFKKSNGIFDNNYDIVFSHELIFDQQMYEKVERIDEDMFYCRLVY